MKKYHFSVKINKTYNNAGSKATDDCKTILLNNGFENLEISFIKAWYLLPFNILKLLSVVVFYTIRIKRRSLIFVQYPLLGINKYFKFFANILKKKGCKFSCIIHDLDSIRSKFDKNKIKSEIASLSAYDAVISHNGSMSKWLKDNGYEGYITEIQLFDYLVSSSIKNDNLEKNELVIAFAGSLGRGNFLPHLIKGKFPFHLNLYGQGFNKIVSEESGKILWHGSFSPEQIVDEIQGDFGLIWDGDSINEISGLMGKYLQYNTPHKTSLYLVSGMPVIASKQSAIAEFIESNNIGFCINNITEIYQNRINISDKMYSEMKANSLKVSKHLKQGYYLRRALLKVQQFFISEM